MTVLLPVLATAIMSTATIQNPSSQPDQTAITVTGHRLQAYRDALAACLARNCPTNEDVDASLALAEAQFVEGEYDEARFTVARALRRNRDAAGAFPEPVSDLYRAQGRILRHLGLDTQAFRSARHILYALQEGIPSEDHRHFTARMEISVAFMQAGRLNEARSELAHLARIARRAGREDVAVFAELRSLLYSHMADPHGGALRQLERMAQSQGADDRMRSVGARVLLSRIYRDQGRIADADALVAGIALSAGGPRRLVHEPDYRLGVQPLAPVNTGGGNVDALESAGIPARPMTSAGNLSDTFEETWIDVGFWVLPDGRVTGLEVVRHQSRTDWAEPLLQSIAGRVYSAAPQATYRLERYSYTAGYEQRTGSRLFQRTMAARAEYFDLTEGAVPPASPPPAAPEPAPAPQHPAR